MENKIISDLKKMGIKNVKENEPLYKHTTYRVGGPALVFVEVIDLEEFKKVMDYVIENEIKYFILGNGSNVLFSDKLFSGVIISTKLLNNYEISGSIVYALCGVNLISLAHNVAFEGLSGLEFASGIPGFIGGSIFMNAGAYKKSMADVVKRILVYNNGTIEWINNEQAMFAYRKSIFQKDRHLIVLAAELELSFDDKESILELMQKRSERRNQTQPYDAYSAGSVFKNPSDDVFSWQLIDQVCLRGYAINDAQVSLKHSNFIINNERASSQDLYDLIKYVQFKVFEQTGVKLKIEQELVNFDEG